jgi:hypothetical protein
MATRRRNKKIKRVFRVLIRFSTILLVLFLSGTLIQVASLRFINPPFTLKLALDYINHLIKLELYHRPIYIWRLLSFDQTNK